MIPADESQLPSHWYALGNDKLALVALQAALAAADRFINLSTRKMNITSRAYLLCN